MNTDNQVSYWHKGAQEDLLVARELLQSGRLRHGLFFAHLALEKILKAHMTAATQSPAPKLHNLLQLARLAGVSLSSEQLLFLREFSAYSILARYPDETPINLDAATVCHDFDLCQEVFDCLQSMLP